MPIHLNNSDQSDLVNSVGLTRILIIGQDKTITSAIETELSRQGYQIKIANSEKSGLFAARKTRPDLVILDELDADVSSFELCRRLRLIINQAPIILLASVCNLNSSLTGFEAGVDDCITQPFQMEELLVRIRVRLRYAHKEKPPILQFDNLILNCQKRQVYWSSQELKLTAKEFDLLKYLMLHYRQVISRYELIEHLWGAEYDVCSSVVDTYICRLRFKLKRCSQEHLIQTVHGVGYKLSSSQSNKSN
ncbi:MAG: response regulator transcription factor [Leptolyngbyaceae cyanobacterium SM1_1_3]|nr:response regulator transcription factor [Leptolyngbyaceae cyanobacterium SM1_1_3]NJN02638.1 response regulator transcription factor [Leptolyngbyaceae cyanobacterium RM1_1_2]NJO09957.1 response regulator transcription factor [Leptolyngbyaceae cyanobacterium SL_1_1]